MIHHIGNFLLIATIFLLFNKRFVNYALSTIFLSVCALLYAYFINDFSLISVYSSSGAGVANLYKLSAIWATNDGSMLLWCLILISYLAFFNKFTQNSKVKDITIIIQSIISAIFVIFTFYIANPFKKMAIPYEEGIGLNPVLQDVALAIHPPILYIGYIGYSILFSISIAILLTRNYDEKYFKLLNSYSLFAFGILTLGIGLGSWWAYRELGWGGFWFWDPVENVSLLPFLLGLGAIHALYLAKKMPKLKFFSLFICIISFLSSVLGTFITRSNLVNSLHTFANNAESSIYLFLIFCTLFAFSASIFIAYFVKDYKVNEKINYKNRKEILIFLNIICCIILFIVILFGILSPLAVQFFYGSNIYIENSFYNPIFSKISIILALGIILFPVLSIKNFFSKYLFTLTALPLMAFYLYSKTQNYLYFSVAFTGAFLMAAMTEHFIKSSLKIKKITPSKLAFYFAHFGFGLLLVSVILSVSGSIDKKKYFKITDSLIVKNYNIALQNLEVIKNENFNGIKGIFAINYAYKLKPEFRFYKKENLPNAETAILYGYFDNLQIIISGIDENLGLATEIYYKPFINLVWLSVILIVISVFMKLTKFV